VVSEHNVHVSERPFNKVTDMSSDSSHPRIRVWQMPLALIAPNPPVAVLIFLGCLTEIGLLLCVPHHIFKVTGPTLFQVPGWIFCFWFHLGWGMWAAITLVSFISRGTSRTVGGVPLRKRPGNSAAVSTG